MEKWNPKCLESIDCKMPKELRNENFKHSLGILIHLCKIISWNVLFVCLFILPRNTEFSSTNQCPCFLVLYIQLCNQSSRPSTGQEAHFHIEYPIVTDSSWYSGEEQLQSRLFVFKWTCALFPCLFKSRV